MVIGFEGLLGFSSSNVAGSVLEQAKYFFNLLLNYTVAHPKTNSLQV
jgi:hypothetical protein